MTSRSLIVLACGLALSLPACDSGSATPTGASPAGSSQAALSLRPMPDTALCDTLRSAVTRLSTEVSGLAVSDTADAVRAALGDVKAAVNRVCPSASPTPSR